MKKCTLTLVCSSLLFLAPLTQASTGQSGRNNNINLQINNDTLSAGFDTHPLEHIRFFGNGQYSDDHGSLAQGGVEVVQNDGPFTFGLGSKAIFIHARDRKDGGVVALGGHADYRLNDRLKVGAETYYSPDMLSFHHVDRYLSYGAKATYYAADAVGVTLGWRRTTFDYSAESDLRYENNFYLGTDYNF